MTATKDKEPVLDEGRLQSLIGYRIAKARLATQTLFARHIGTPFSLRAVEYSLLMLLHANRVLTPKQLSRALALPGPNLTILMDRLQARGLIERVRSEVDRRSQQALLTAEGQALARQLDDLTPNVEQDLDGPLSRGELVMLAELLDKVANATRDRGGEAAESDD
ncbi:MAG: MarR family transcriptional regulator [Rubrivivax sp.]|nr:MAG: MarR family transcriptional regulator [Rubrivivax sp.]